MKTFIVEDNPIILEKLASTLQELIVDIFLKGGLGLGVLRRTAQRGPGKRVVLTNYATPDIRQTCRALGADRVFDKSSELEELIAYCERVAGGGDSAPGALG